MRLFLNLLPSPLPSPPAAFSRRAALFGAVAATGYLTAAAPKFVAGVAGIEINDAELTALAAEIDATLDGAAYAFDHVTDEDEQDRRIGHANDLTLDMAAKPAAGLAGVLAKAKAYLDSESYDVLHLAELSTSLAEDVERLHAEGGLV